MSQGSVCEGWNTRGFFKTANADEVVACLAAGADPNDRDEHGSTPLHWSALLSADPRVLTKLLEAGADPEACDRSGARPLHSAASGTNMDPLVLTALLQADADPNARDDRGGTPLHRAVWSVSGRYEDRVAVATLLDAGAHPMARNSRGETPLHKMLWQMDAAVVRDVLAAGADCNARDQDGMTVLHRAAHRGCNGGVVAALLVAGADPTERNDRWSGWTPLHFAAEGAMGASAVTTLLDAGADVMAVGADGRTPLHLAAERGTPSKIAALLDAGADPTVQDDRGRSPRDYAHKERDYYGTLFAVLLDHKADPMQADGDGWRPLDLAARNEEHALNWFGHRDAVDAGAVSALIRAGADPIARDKHGSTPFHEAAACRGVALVRAFLAAGADPMSRSTRHELTPLHSAAWRNEDSAVVGALIDGGADPQARSKTGDTPLHHARSEGIVRALAKAGADPRVTNSEGDTPLHCAAQWAEDPRAVTALVELGAFPMARTDNSGNDDYWTDAIEAASRPLWMDRRITPLHRAAAHNRNAEVVTALLQAGAEAGTRTANDATALHAAAVNENEDVTLALLDAGGDPAAVDQNGVTPLHYAAGRNSNAAVLRALLDHGADPNAPIGDRLPVGLRKPGVFNDDGMVGGDTPLHYAVSRYHRNPECVQALLAAGAEAGARNSQGNTPLHYLGAGNDEASVTIALSLLESGADPKATNGLGETPLHGWARSRTNPAVVPLLLEAGADPGGADCNGTTPLHRAEESRVVDALIRAGADPMARDKHGDTPLHYLVASVENAEPIETLIAKGSNPDWSNQLGDKPLDRAVRHGNCVAIEVLLDAGAIPNGRSMNYARKNRKLEGEPTLDRLTECWRQRRTCGGLVGRIVAMLVGQPNRGK